MPAVPWCIVLSSEDTNLLFSIVGYTNGNFVVNSNKVKIKEMTETTCILDILSGKSFIFTLAFVDATTGTRIEKEIKVLPL